MSQFRSCSRVGVVAAVVAAVVVFGALAVGVGAAPAAAQAAGAPALLNCSTTTYRFLFWPKGHPAVPSQSFPAFATPHAEVYSGTGTSYPDREYLAYVDATGAANHAATCVVPATAAGGGAVPAASLKTTTKVSALTCTVSSAFVLTVPNANGKALINVVTPTETVATASMAATGSRLDYDKRLCKASKAPR